MNQPNNDKLIDIRIKVEQLILDAENSGVVVSIDLKPLEPLAMGNHKMVASVSLKHNY